MDSELVTRVVGIGSAVVLMMTLLWQLRAQWKKGSSEGVSRFLFVGQLAASIGFAVYSARIGDAVFIATNVALAIFAIVGVVLTLTLKRRASRGSWHDRTARRAGAPSPSR